MLKIDFEKTDLEGKFIYKDALYLPEDHTFTDIELEAMKQERFDKWLALVSGGTN